MFRKFFFIILFVLTMSPLVVSATPTVPPEKNPLCWRKSDCINQRKVFDSSVSENEGWIKEDPCVGDWGKCLPPLKTETKIAFGGQKEFADIGLFLQTIYKYAITIASILAVAVIVISGAQWAVSGGSSDMIGKAKKRIGGAVIGLFIAFMSYFILNSINPALVNLRLPQTWLMRPFNLVTTEYCVEMTSSTPVAEVATENDSPPESSYFQPFNTLPASNAIERVFPRKEDNTMCGRKYMVRNSGGRLCLGRKCSVAGQVCKKNGCEAMFAPGKGGIGGSIAYKDGKYLDNIWLKVLCTDGSVRSVDLLDLGDGVKDYVFNDVIVESVFWCGSEPKVSGYFFIVEVNDSDPGPTSDDQWLGGRSFCYSLTSRDSCGIFGEANIGSGQVEDELANGLRATNSLFPLSDIKNGILCDFQTSKLSMPNVGVGMLRTDIEQVASWMGADRQATLGLMDSFTGKGEDSYMFGRNYNCPYLDSTKAAMARYMHDSYCRRHPAQNGC